MASILFDLYIRRLKDKVKNRLVDDFVKALELLSSPELVFKVHVSIVQY